MSKSKTGKGRKKHDREDKESLAFKVLSQEQTKELQAIDNVDVLQEKMLTLLSAAEHTTDLKAGVLLDYYVAGVWWAKEQAFTTEQLSAFYSVLHTLLDNLQEKHMALLENLREFKKLLAGIGLDNSELSGGLECFDVAQSVLICNYIHTSFFQHYKLFEFITSHTQAEEIIGTDLEIQVAAAADTPWPPPLQEGISQLVYNEHIAERPESEKAEEKTEEEIEAEKKAAEEAATAKEEASKVVDLLSQLKPEEVKAIMNQVFDDMLSGFKTDMASKLRDKENAFITRINKVHKVAEK